MSFHMGDFHRAYEAGEFDHAIHFIFELLFTHPFEYNAYTIGKTIGEQFSWTQSIGILLLQEMLDQHLITFDAEGKIGTCL